MNQRQFPASPNRFLTWLMLTAAVAAVTILLAAPGVVWGQNDQPAFSAKTTGRSVAENTVPNQPIGDPVSAVDADSGETLTYSISGTDVNAFNFDTSKGQLKTKDALDHESKDTYAVTIGVSDSKDAGGDADTTVDDTITVTINVTDINEPPGAPSAPTVTALTTDGHINLDVSWAAPAAVGIPAISDYDVRYKKEADTDWTDANFVDTATNTILSGLEAITKYKVQVRATNDEGSSPWSSEGQATTSAAPLSFGSATINDHPYTVGVTISTLQLPKATGGTGSITYTLSPMTPPSGLTFTESTRQITGTPDTVTASAISYTYTASDTATTATLPFTITVVANQPPTANAGPNQNVGEGDTVTLDGSGSSDPEDEALTYAWSQTTDASVQLSNPASVQPTFTAPAVNRTLTFSLLVPLPGRFVRI